MLDTYLENFIRNKLSIVFHLYIRHSLSLTELSDILGISSLRVATLIDELILDLHELADFEQSDAKISLNICGNVSYYELLPPIYQSSSTLQCLRFLLMNDKSRPFSHYMDTAYLSKSQAYRIRESCLSFLHTVGLDIQQNKVVGDEYRIRFLIALLHCYYGIDFDYFNEESVNLARRFILSTNKVIDMNFLEQTVDEYGFFEHLLILSWKRKSYSLYFSMDSEMQRLKRVFIYDRMKLALKNFVEPALNLTYAEEDYDYLYLAYCATNSCIFADQWSSEEISKVHEIIFSFSRFSDLLCGFRNKFGEQVCCLPAFRSMLIYFAKRCLLGLQCLIPDKHFYLNATERPSMNVLLRYVKEILNTWKQDGQVVFPLDESHIAHLAFQFEMVLRQYLEPVSVILISDLTVDLELAKLWLSKRFSHRQIRVIPLLLNAETHESLFHMEHSVIIVNHKFKTLIDALMTKGNKSNYILLIRTELNFATQAALETAINQCEEMIFTESLTQYEHS